MPRSLWSGTLSFGLVNVPVQLISAVRDADVHFRQVHEEDGAPIDVRRFCEAEEREVAQEEIGHGYELDDGRQVVLTADELATVAPERTRTIDIQAFVALADVDPIYFNHPYFLLPAGEAQGPLRAYRLLLDVMGRGDRAALGRVVLRTKEHLVLVRVRGRALGLTTLRFHDEVRAAPGLPGDAAEPAKQALEHARALIEELSVEWDPARYSDCYRERLLDVIERKRRGQTITAPKQEPAPKPAPDLMAALQASLAAVRGGGSPAAPAPEPDADSAGGDLDELSREELYERAKAAGVPGRSSMTKQELVAALSGG